MIRRKLFTRAAALASISMLAGCGLVTTNANGTITVNLANAQAEATAIESALASFVTESLSALPASVQAKAKTAWTDLQAAVAAFVGLPTGTVTFAAAAQAVVKAVQGLVPLLPLPSVTQTAISTGLLLISGLIAGVASITVPTAAPSTGVGAAAVVSGPIPIPLG